MCIVYILFSFIDFNKMSITAKLSKIINICSRKFVCFLQKTQLTITVYMLLKNKLFTPFQCEISGCFL